MLGCLETFCASYYCNPKSYLNSSPMPLLLPSPICHYCRSVSKRSKPKLLSQSAERSVSSLQLKQPNSVIFFSLTSSSILTFVKELGCFCLKLLSCAAHTRTEYPETVKCVSTPLEVMMNVLSGRDCCIFPRDRKVQLEYSESALTPQQKPSPEG